MKRWHFALCVWMGLAAGASSAVLAEDLGFVIRTIDDTPNAGFVTDLVLDSLGTPHVSYRIGGGEGTLVYAVRSLTGEWDIQRPGGLAAGRTNIGLTSDGLPWISHTSADTTKSVFVAHQLSNTVWVREFVAEHLNSGPQAAMDIGPGDVVYVVYTDNREVRLAERFPDTGWVDQLVETGNFFECDIAVDALGHPHILYREQIGNELRYATRNDQGDWAIEVVVGSAAVAPQIALASDGTPHIIYTVADNPVRFLWYATRSDVGVWSNEFLVDIDQDAAEGAITLVEGIPHIVYSSVEQKLILLRKIDETWVSCFIDSEFRSGAFPAIRIDSLGRIGVAYQQLFPNKFLRYASGGPLTSGIDGPQAMPRLVLDVYPVPVGTRGLITIDFEAAQSETETRLSIFDTSGRLMKDFRSGKAAVPSQSIQFVPGSYGMGPGVYFARISSENGTAVRKIVVR